MGTADRTGRPWREDATLAAEPGGEREIWVIVGHASGTVEAKQEH